MDNPSINSAPTQGKRGAPPTMPKSTTNICLIGNKFMGRAHANAFLKVNKFFTDLPSQAVMHTVVGRNVEENETFATRWGFANTNNDWKAAIKIPEIDLVDVPSPNNVHAEMSLAP